MIVARRPFARIPRHFRAETSPSIPKVPKLMFSDPPLPNSFPCHTSAKSARNSFRCHTYKFALLQVLSLPHIQKTGGVPFGVRRSCRRFHNRHPRAQSTISSRCCDITSFLLASQPHLTQELLK